MTPKNQEHWKAMGNPGQCGFYPKALGKNQGIGECLKEKGWPGKGFLRRPRPPVTEEGRTTTDLAWSGLAADEACPLCGHTSIDGDHQLQCAGLDEYPTDDVVSRYWELGVK
ncbi:hypothetical protein TNCV_1201411 [Trichonephila clavipes]|nr:hypothetical protein TNCV_1201411 [Trichonephila clavipes]